MNEVLEAKKRSLFFADMINAKDFGAIEELNSDTIIADLSDQTKEETIPIHTEVNPDNLKKTCQETYKIFKDDELSDIVNDKIHKTPIIIREDADDYHFDTNFCAIKNGAKLYKVPTNITVPRYIDKKTVNHFFAHEMAHILKSYNLNEQRLFITYEETIPILIELISAHNCELDTKEVFTKRKDLILESIAAYNYLKKLYENKNYEDTIFEELTPNEQESMLKFEISHAGNYLNSFYYSLCFYNYYIHDEQTMLKCISQILKANASTLDLIRVFERQFSLKEIDENYQEGLENFKLKLK